MLAARLVPHIAFEGDTAKTHYLNLSRKVVQIKAHENSNFKFSLAAACLIRRDVRGGGGGTEMLNIA